MTILKHVDFEVPDFGELADGPRFHAGSAPALTYRQTVESLSGRLLDLRLDELTGATAVNLGSAGVHGSYHNMDALGITGLITGDPNGAADFIWLHRQSTSQELRQGCLRLLAVPHHEPFHPRGMGPP